MNTPPRKQTESGLYAPVWREFNKLIDYVREISITGSRNVRVSRSLNGTTLVGELKTTNETTGLNFRGEYDPTETYQEDDVVIYGSSENTSILIDGTKAGTYIANETVNPGESPSEPANGKWRTFARFATPTFAVTTKTAAPTQSNPNNVITGRVLTTSDTPGISITKSDDVGSISIALADANHKVIKLREIGVCVNGVTKKMLVLGSEIY